ncbi:hypothetical protein CERSUDRAFT_98807 [Gelatoporia subvermispora B]|uniref:Sld7 C-terminal domain-containing protein n=1 Tax=Ceriporiopsis subvermispora (strain B) TaxID=914234 RepID=M2PC33_CERS8|nr:hypothetical protein CERSUDRAFT_98807 [Gelatoporia subvermispora B]
MSANNHRLLYRGALSLPDTNLLLDGLSFTIRVGDTQSASGLDLLNNPLALALESMRGRNLHLLGTTNLNDVWLDAAGDVSMDIHPKSTLSRMYFENILCSYPITSAKGRTDEGIRVSLSDNNEPGPNDILIFGQLEAAPGSEPSTSTAPPKTLRILAARILPAPPAPARPRPDDPTPRQPPLLSNGKRKRETSSLSLALDTHAKRVAGDKGKARDTGADADPIRRAREVMLGMPKPGGRAPKDGRVGKSQTKDAAVFKVPPLPDRTRSMPHVSSQSPVATPDAFAALADELEKANKTIVKKVTVQCLSDRGIRKGRDDFNELYQYIYRGTCFALRTRMRVSSVDAAVVEALVDSHANLYVVDDETRSRLA